MTRWWLVQRRKLWWKETREVLPIVGLGWVIILILLVSMTPAGGFEAFYDSSRFLSGAFAILLFIAVVLGVTAYALEEEYETITPLLARPIPVNDIFATKLGIRLGLLCLSMIVIGLIELWTGAWPIEYRIPSPLVFHFWLSDLTVLVLGLGLGLYFGKIFGRQTPALVASGLVLIAGYVFLDLSPLDAFFEGDLDKNYLWIRDLLIPAIAALVMFLAAFAAPVGEEGTRQRSRPVAVAASLALYAVILWSVTMVPQPGSRYQPKTFWDIIVITRGSPGAVLGILEKRFLEWESRYNNGEDVGRAVNRFIAAPGVTSPMLMPRSWGYGYLGNNNYTLLGEVSRTKYEEPNTGEVRSSLDLESDTARLRSGRWIGRCLELAKNPARSELWRLMAIHLAGVAAHPEHTEAIASFLTDPNESVRVMAAWMLLGRGDPRGHDYLTRKWSERIRDSDYWYHLIDTLDPGPEWGDVMRSWAISEEIYSNRNHARRWLLRYGSTADLDLIRRSLAMDDMERYSPLQIPGWWLLPYLKAFGSSRYREVLRETVQSSFTYLESLYPSVRELPPRIVSGEQSYWSLGSDDRSLLSSFRNARNRFFIYLEALFLEKDPGAISIWQQSRVITDLYLDTPRLDGRVFWPGYNTFLGLLPVYGDEGFEVLRAITMDPEEHPLHRFQAALLLDYHGFHGYHELAFHLADLYQDRYLQMKSSSTIIAYRRLLEKGHLQYAGRIIELAWEDYSKGDNGSIRSWRILDHPTVTLLTERTEQEFGWDLKKWKKWWEREGVRIAATGNNE